MVITAREREDKYDVADDFILPEIVDVSAAINASVERDRLELRSVYYDTAQLDLAHHGVTLHHRSGSVDPGWQLKFPDEPARIQLTAEHDDSAVPEELRAVVAGIRQGRRLKRIADLHIVRDVRTLVSTDGQMIATISDDTVQALALAGGTSSEWREVQVELGDAGEDTVLDALRTRLIEAGARQSSTVSKLTHLLTSLASPPGTAPSADTQSEADPVTAGKVVQAYLNRQHEALLRGDVALRAGEDAVQDTRVAARRMRATLRTFTELFDPDRAQALDGELGWYAGLLSEVRDRDTLRARLDAAIHALPAEAVADSAAAHLDQVLRDERDQCHAALQHAMTTRRYRALLDDLAAWTESPPTTPAAGGTADTLLPVVHATQHLVGDRMAQIVTDAEDNVLDRARQAAKRARYATEVGRPLSSKRHARRQAQHYAHLQEILGDYRDAIAAARFLRAVQPDSAQEAFTYGALYAEQCRLARRIRRRIIATA